jgi:DNA-binding transcriptional ArsR family regulator
VNEHSEPRLQAVHRALADPLRIRLFELLVLRPQSAKELAAQVGLRPDRLYHHLAQLEEGKLIEIAEYRPLAGGKVERVYAPTAVEPLVDDASPADVARLLGAALETTRADINAATLAKQAGEERLVSLSRTGVRLNAAHLAELRAAIEDLLLRAREHPDEDGVWTTVLWTAVDREDRRGSSAGAGSAGDIGTVTTASRARGKPL